mmetsp:Transcript_8962/g.12336  ORF Transcript_8962/g.12336 Transcript_8962/m.12336 type:complete len:262 (+) Transcript_8962:105-890(+)
MGFEPLMSAPPGTPFLTSPSTPPLTTSSGNCCRIVKLNIGGFKYCTSVATLTKHPNTFFTAILSEHIPTTIDEEGAYFIDRDGQYFAPILTWLRTNEVVVPKDMTKEDVLREAHFYSLQPLIDLLSYEEDAIQQDEEKQSALDCPPEIRRYVLDYWQRHEKTILTILRGLNKEGSMNVTAQIVPGHRQDFERPPQLLENGRLGLYMNFTILRISKYTHVQYLLAECFREEGISGFFRPGEQIDLCWGPNQQIKRKNDIFYF